MSEVDVSTVSRGGTMQKWEYFFAIAVWERGVFVVRYVNGAEVHDWKRQLTNIATYSNQLGQQGWELVATGSPATGSELHYHFKRRIP
jgi:hypothetical protein